ncbi:hat family dimerization domaincontaining protein-related [Holotrichia oblita]|uniref:Hat family dimerization domaincontaining protein-related n=1 Tax=Holotrichia oblita TaxID=644536 RepID=A0ACB9SKA8_HOLOL|nr:hat family dimerization domaincontaining protein-related [Holotrichia oblita]
MKEITGSTANDLYGCLKNVVMEKKIPFDNLVGYSSDTTNVMFGDNHSVYTLLKQDLPYIVCIKCSCHLIHLAASKACLSLPRSVEDTLRNIGAHFSRSPARQEKLKEIQTFFKYDIHKILLPAATRWLSLCQCVDRVLEQLECLIAYFRVESLTDPSRTTENILNILLNPITKLYLEFMSYVLGLLTDFNKLFQSESPLLYKLKYETESLLKTILLNFMKKEFVINAHIFNLNHKNPHYFCTLEDIYLGLAATQTLQDLKQTLPKEEISSFLKNCLSFYIELSTEIKNRFVFTDPIFEIIDILDPLMAQCFKIKSLSSVTSKFPFLKQYIDCQKLDNEWRQHGLMDHKLYNLDPLKSAAEYWNDVMNLKNAAGIKLFSNLEVVIQFLLVLPFSNAPCERIFSDLNNIKTDKRNNMVSSTITALLHTKQGIKESDGVIKFEPSPEMLRINVSRKTKHPET